MKKVQCWVCWGEGWVKGIYYDEPCPNPKCPHRKEREEQPAP